MFSLSNTLSILAFLIRAVNCQDSEGKHDDQNLPLPFLAAIAGGVALAACCVALTTNRQRLFRQPPEDNHLDENPEETMENGYRLMPG